MSAVQLVHNLAAIALNMSHKLKFMLISNLLAGLFSIYFCVVKLQLSAVGIATFVLVTVLPCLILLPFFLVFRSLAQLPQTLREMPPQFSSVKDAFAPLTKLKQPQKLGFFGLLRALWTLMRLKDSLATVFADSLAGWSGHYWSLLLISNPITLLLLLLACLLWIIIIVAVFIISIILVLF